MKYLVLGSAGVIGKPLCNHLRSEGHEVIEFDIENSETEDLRLYQNPWLRKCIEQCDFIFFLSWDVGGSLYLEKYQDSYEFIQNNLKIITNTFEAIRIANKPFIFASSQMANMSYSTYGITKMLGEKLTQALNGLTVKFWNVYGYEHDLNKSHVITDFILKAKNTGIIDMRTDGTESRQMLYADDCSECLYQLSKVYSELDKTKNYHITSFEWNTVAEIAEIIAGCYQGATIIAGDKVDIQKDLRNTPDPHILTYWQPKVSLRQGIRKIINRMKEDEVAPPSLTPEFWDEKHKKESHWLTGTPMDFLYYIFTLTTDDLIDKKILEIGVGTGSSINHMSSIASELYACDISQIGLDKIKDKVKQTFLTTELSQCPPVDIAIAHLVFVHCNDDEVLRILNDINLTETGAAYVQFSILEKEPNHKVKKYLIDDGSHHFRTLDEIKALIEQSNKQIRHIEPPHNPGSYMDYDLPQLWYYLVLENKK